MRTCLHCQTELTSEYAEKFCDRSCAAKYNNAHREVNPEWWDHLRADNRCRKCGSKLKSSRFRFCSEICKEEAMKKKSKPTDYSKQPIYVVLEQNFKDDRVVSLEIKNFASEDKARFYFLTKVDAYMVNHEIKDDRPENWKTKGVMYQTPLWSIELFKDDLIL